MDVCERFEKAGLSKDRLDLLGPMEADADHMGAYGQLDIALDPFPYNGTTTTCDALWMGMPVVTLAGRMHAGRVGVSLLTAAGLPELIAQSPEEYIQIAATLAADPARLIQTHRDLRERMSRSPLVDGKGFSRRLGAALLALANHD